MPSSNYDYNVFINCPFDSQYMPLFEAVVFAVLDSGFIARCAKEVRDSGQVRIDKIFNIIRECRYGIHDISRTELDELNGLPRFNMPLELGMFLGAREFGIRRQKKKLSLILDRESNRYRAFCSDISGQDIEVHENSPERLITIVRDWLSDSVDEIIPSGVKIVERYNQFRVDLPLYCQSLNQSPDELTFIDFRNLVGYWLAENSWEPDPL